MQYVREHTGLILLCIGFFLVVTLGAGAVAQVAFREDTSSTQDDLCEAIEPVQTGLTSLIQGDIQDSQRGLESGDYQRFFPGIPPDELRKLILDGVERQQAILTQIELSPTC